MSNLVNAIGERVRNFRTQAGLSQEDLAEKAGLHSSYIGVIERGEKTASIESVEKIVIALDITFEALFEGLSTGSNVNPIPLACYDMINSLSLAEQKAIHDLIIRIIEFRKL